MGASNRTYTDHVAGRIRDEDIAAVRDRARIDDVVREYVTLKSAGGGSLKGLCPFHDERTPSFHVTPSRGMWYCFGCSEGGDVLNFVQKIDHLSFAEAVEKLAGRTGVQLRYVEGGAAVSKSTGQRTRLVEAHTIAAEFFRAQLEAPEAQPGRTFLTERGFDADAAARFGIGFAPKSWDALTSHLRSRGFSEAEILAGGLASQGNRGIYDRFRGRLVWPIRDLGGDVVGFGARRLLEDDDGPKYLNTPETPLYKKSQVLYGIDLARRDIAKEQQVVVVEGYTDVMACHLAGVTTAVATCGTAFGSDHIKVLRRLLMDDAAMRGSVVFTFDGDAAGQKAALKAFNEDQRFMAHTYVAVAKDGLDPCDLRLAQGDGAVRALVEDKVPLFEFAIKQTISAYDLNTAEGRIAALREAAPIISTIRDAALRPEYARRLAGWLGMDASEVTRVLGRSTAAPGARTAPLAPNDPTLAIERQALKCALQYPGHVYEWYSSVEDSAFTHPRAIAVHSAIAATGGPSADRDGLSWIDAVLDACPDDDVRGSVRELAVDPIPADETTIHRYATGIIARLLERDASRRVEELRGRMQRSDEDATQSQELLAEIMALEEYRRSLLREALGES
jgi:DNA primase